MDYQILVIFLEKLLHIKKYKYLQNLQEQEVMHHLFPLEKK